MTREEIIRNLKYTMKKHKNDTVNTFETNISAMCKDILDYLEQQPCEDNWRFYYNHGYAQAKRDLSCEDCISRQAVLETIEDCNSDGLKGIFCSYNDGKKFEEYIKALPSVTPKEKTGKWIDDEFGSKCSCCGRYTHLDKFDRPMKFIYCTMCGARMIEPQESEE